MKNFEMNLNRFGWDDVEKAPGSGSKTNYTKLENGMNTLRCLDNEPFSRWTHWLNAQKRRITCLGKANNCPFCEANQKAKDLGEKKMPFPVSMRFAMNVINKKTNELEILDQGRDFFLSLLDIHKEVGDVTTYDIKVKTTNAGTTDVNHTIIPGAPTPLSDEEVAMIADKKDLKDAFKAPTHEQAVALRDGKTPEEVFGGGTDNKSSDKDESIEVE